MEARDRRLSLGLFAAAGVAWIVVGAIGFLVDPFSSAMAGFLGAAALGTAIGVNVMPLFWLAGFARQRRIAYRGDWLKAIRRGAWVGVLVAVFVVMRLNGVFQPQIGLFLIALAFVAEVTLTAGSTNRG
ncbi:MAG: hypothetical protein HYX55_01300 [Chloroflexi bacterium]|nr:hypothetical protein [Chloroflexota bacterium]